MRGRPKQSVPDRVRALAKAQPGLSRGQLALTLRVPVKAVHNALKHTSGKRGPKPAEVATVVMRVRVPVALQPYIDARIKEGGGVYEGKADALVAAAEVELVPDGEWATYVAVKRAATAGKR